MQDATVITWPNVDDPLTMDRRVRIIDDLLGAILLLAALVFAALLELTRRRICAVYQLAFLLCAGCAVFIVGGLVDHHLSDDQLQLALYGSFLSSSLTTTYVYLPLGASAAAALVGVFHLSLCSCECCCLQGTRCATHRDCFTARLRANSALFATTLVMLWVLIGIRLNARLRASAINPVGGTVHWMLLRSPFYLAVAHIGSVAMVELKLFLQHADKAPTSHDASLRPQAITAVAQPTPSHPLSLAQAEAMASAIDELMRPPPVAKIRQPTAAVASTGMTTATTSAAEIVRRASLPQTPDAHTDHPTERDGVLKVPLKDTVKSGHRQPGAASVSTSQRLTLRDLEIERPTTGNNDGDVSALISSDSDSDEDVLTPNFNASSMRTRLLASSSVAGTRRVASITSSASSSSRPTSPALSSVSSRSSSSSSSNSSSASRPRAPSVRCTRPADKLLTRSRFSNSEHSFSAPRFASDSPGVGPKRSYYYYSDSNNNRPSTASSTTSSFSTSSSLSTSTAMSVDGLRRRIPHTPAVQTPVGPTGTANASAKGSWVECFDATTGNVYYYNQITGESRWQHNF